MPDLLEEFARRRKLLMSLQFAEAKIRLSGFLEWMESEPSIKAILDAVRGAVDTGHIIEGCDHRTPPAAGTPEEVAAVGLLLMERCREGEELFQLAHKLGISPPYSTSKLQDHSDEALRRFVEPALDYIEDELRESYEEITTDSLVDTQLSATVFSDLTQNYPLTAERLERIAGNFAVSDDDGEWFNVGNSCREAFKTFTEELRELGKIQIPDDLKAGDVKNILSRALGTMKGKGRFEETLVKLVAAAWDHSQPITHRASTTRHEALRLFIWTTLSISEIAKALE